MAKCGDLGDPLRWHFMGPPRAQEEPELRQQCITSTEAGVEAEERGKGQTDNKTEIFKRTFHEKFD